MTEVRSFLRLRNDFWRLVPNLAIVPSTLTNKLRNGEPKTFEPLEKYQHKAFDTLKTNMMEPPVLDLPRLKDHFTVDTDVRDIQMGCVLLPEEPYNNTRTIVYCWRTLNLEEIYYYTDHRECIPVVWAVLLLRTYFEGSSLKISTDHDALRLILNMTDATKKNFLGGD